VVHVEYQGFNAYGCKQDNMKHIGLFGDYLLGIYFGIFLEYFEQYINLEKS
jgi:hypothetical protein